MAVVPFPNLPPQGPQAGMSWELRSLTARHVSPLSGVATTLERPGAHWSARFPYSNLATDRRARVQTLAASLRGHANRTYAPVFGWTRRGSFPAPEILSNPYFANGTTGWSSSSEITKTVADGIYRGTRNANTLTMALIYAAPNPTVTQYAPHVWRVLVSGKRYPVNLRADVQNNAATENIAVGASESASSFLQTIPFVPYDTAALPRLIDLTTAGLIAGDYVEVAYASLSRCALVDNGPNATLQSDNIEHASWTKANATASAVNGTAPDGVADAPALIEDTASSVHSLLQSYTRASAIADICAYGYFKRRTGTRDVRLFTGDIAGGNYAGCTFDLGAGTAGSVTHTGTATNGRAFIVPVGNFWYYCALVVRTPASVNARVTVEMSNAGSTNYLGDGSSSVYVWRIGGALSSVPTRGMQTTTTADADGVLQTGSALHLKGLPASTNGLLLQGDPAEIIIGTTSQLVRTRGSLDSDAAGRGYFQFEPPLRVSPSDNAGVIICNPLCKMMLDSNDAGWSDRMGGFSDLELAMVEDTYPS